MRILKTARCVATALLLSGASGVAASAQSLDCEALRQQMAAVTQPDPGRLARFARAIEQQRSELARTEAYSDSIGCGGLHIFGGAPAQCDAIETRISRMQGNLDSLQSQAQTLRNGNPDAAQDLAARYDSYCRTAPGRDDGALVYNDPGLMPGDASPEAGPAASRGGDKAICVRTCDGGYFPLSTGVGAGDIGDLQAICSAQCPNTEAKLYTTRDTDNIADAVGADGTAYSELPNAFNFTKSHEASCTCKPPNQSWVEALARAEELLEKENGDVTVTEKMSADMARPTQPGFTPTRKGGRRDRKTRIDLPPPPPVPDDAGIGALAAQAPTAGSASAGIAAKNSSGQSPTVRTDEGSVRTEPAPDGSRRKVRIIGPAP